MISKEVKDRQSFLVQLFHSAPICKSYGMRMHYDNAGSAVFTLPYNPGFDHALGAIHGAVFATMLDNAGWFTVAAHYETWIATVEFQVRLLEQVAEKDMIATGFPIRIGKRIASAEMEVRTSDGLLVAKGSGTFSRTAGKYPASVGN